MQTQAELRIVLEKSQIYIDTVIKHVSAPVHGNVETTII